MFEYEEGQFGKTLLVSVSETDGNGNVLYANKFDYHDDIEANGGKLFSDEVLEAQTASKFGSDWHFKALDDDFSSHLSNINGASSTGRGLTTGANFGVGFSAASVYGGASYIHNKNEGEGQIVLTDIDGDGLPDRVFRFGSFLFYQPNLYAETGRLGFGAMKRIEGICQIGFTKSVSNGVGADVGIGYGWLSVGCSYSYTKDVSKTKVYFQDFNGDGLVDLADNGTVYFNRIVDGVPIFEKSSFGTPNPIAGTPETVLKALTAVDTVQLRDSLENAYPLQDAVRSWRAPFSGKVNVRFSIACSSESVDGVTCAFQHNSKELKRWKLGSSERADYNEMLDVKVGDHLYFRTLSNYDGKNDVVSWSPSISYGSFTDENLASVKTDENGEDIRQYSAEKDFQPTASSPVSVAGSKSLTVKSTFSLQKPTESVTFAIVRTDKTDRNDTVFTKVFDAGFVGNGELSYEENLSETDTFNYSFVILNQGVISRKSVEWLPIVSRQVKDKTVSDTIIPQRNEYNRIVALVPSSKINADTLKYASDTVYMKTSQTPNAVVVKVVDGVEIRQSIPLQLLQDEIVGKDVNVTFVYDATAAIPTENVVELVRKKERVTLRFDSTFVDNTLYIDTVRTVEIYDTTISKINANVYAEFESGTTSTATDCPTWSSKTNRQG